MAKLIWKGKDKKRNFDNNEVGTTPLQILDLYPSAQFNSTQSDNWQNLLIWGENGEIIDGLLDDFEKKISLIYIDPPFATGGEFNLKTLIGVEGEYIRNVAYKDKWKKGLDSYLTFLHERLSKMKKLLADEGSIYVHLDWHVSHYVKLIMDEIFGIENFRNEIVWAYPAASAKTRRFYIRSYDTILFYSNSDDYIFRDDPNIYQEYSQRVKNALKEDEKGIFYYRGGSHDGRKLSRKVYIDKEGIFPRDVWSDIPYIRANTSEYQGFSTQKPERLLKRIILASTREKDLVADFFCGSGTTLAVAEKLGRRWIGCDLNRNAIHLTRKRILDIANSNDVLDWKNKYKKSANNFRVFTSGTQDHLPNFPKEFLSKDIQIQSISNIKASLELGIKIDQSDNNIVVELIDYKNSYENFISKEIRENVLSFSDWIDYWAIDYDYNAPIFENSWTSFRTPKSKQLKLISPSYCYEMPGDYTLSVKVIDIFGLETQNSYEIKV
ncbi:MAG: site-specific DNA-methyltransferase [Promethearchaeota archaeon]|jgi:DNA modification methylase